MSQSCRNRRYRDSYRGYLIDHHSPDPPVQRLDKLDVREWEEAIRRGHINCMLVYCKDHYGVTYYNTRVGRKHPGVKTDFIAELAEVLRRNDCEFWAYYSVGFDLWAVQQHPQWAVRSDKGTPVRCGAKWPFVCGSTAYRQYVMAQLEEVLAYRPDSMFLDIVMTPVCWCDDCLRLFRERYGFDLPRGTDKQKHWRTLLDWHTEVMQYGLFKELTDHIHRVDPRVPVSFNGCHLHMVKKVQDLFDWTYAEPWAGNFVSAGFARGVGVDSQIGPGGVSQVYNPYPPSVFVAEIAGIAAQGVRPFLFSGSLKPDGSLDRLEFDEIGAAFSEVERYQHLLKGREAVREVAILFSEQSRLFGLDKPTVRDDPGGLLQDAPYNDAVAGAINAAAASKYPWDVLPDWRLTADELAAYRVLVLPNANALSDEQARLIAEWVRQGGRLLATFRTGLKDERGEARANFALSHVLGIDYVGMDETYVGSQDYGSYLENRRGPLWQLLPDTALAVAPPMVQVQARTAAVLATHALPVVKESPQQWVNWWPAPPDVTTGWPAVTLNRWGAGLALYVGFDLPNMVRKSGGRPFIWAWSFVPAALETVLLPEPCIRVLTGHARSLDATYFRVPGRDEVHVHLLNSTVKTLNGDVLPIPGARLDIRDIGFTPATAEVVHPEQKALAVTRLDRRHVIELPPVAIHTIVRVSA